MRLDASAHPDGSRAFTKWVRTERCPYNNCKVQRIVNFEENPDLWKTGKPPTIYQAMKMVLDEKCPGWDKE
jgi:hypothetical protein